MIATTTVMLRVDWCIDPKAAECVVGGLAATTRLPRCSGVDARSADLVAAAAVAVDGPPSLDSRTVEVVDLAAVAADSTGPRPPLRLLAAER